MELPADRATRGVGGLKGTCSPFSAVSWVCRPVLPRVPPHHAGAQALVPEAVGIRFEDAREGRGRWKPAARSEMGPAEVRRSGHWERARNWGYIKERDSSAQLPVPRCGDPPPPKGDTTGQAVR
jgi:hypothetical protein